MLLTLKNHDQIAALTIPAGVRPEEGKRLAYLAAQVPNQGIIVEIGACRGRSTAYIASAIQQCGNLAWFLSIDVWELGEELGTPRSHHANDPYHDYMHNLESLGVFEHVFPYKATSADTVVRFARLHYEIDFLFIDGDHSYAGVRDDFLHWSPLLCSGGVIAFHDYKTAHAGVQQAVDELIDPAAWEIFPLVDTVFSVRKR